MSEGGSGVEVEGAFLLLGSADVGLQHMRPA